MSLTLGIAFSYHFVLQVLHLLRLHCPPPPPSPTPLTPLSCLSSSPPTSWDVWLELSVSPVQMVFRHLRELEELRRVPKLRIPLQVYLCRFCIKLFYIIWIIYLHNVRSSNKITMLQIVFLFFFFFGGFLLLYENVCSIS